VEGHAGYDKRGKDIVCAAVSVTAYTGVGALEELAGISGCHTDSDGFFFCSIPQDITEQQKQVVRIILDTTAVGFKQIALEYPKHVSVLEEEV
jgi:hypothetical protein